MTTTNATGAAGSGGFFSRALDKKATGAAFLIGLAAIGIAWASQLWGGLMPCDLCWGQRVPYYWGLPVLAAILVVWNRIPLTVWYIGMAIAVAIFAWGVYLGGFHAGVEYGWWPGPATCSGSLSGEIVFDPGNMTPIVPCDKPAFTLYGLSLAGMNALVSLAIVALLLLAIADQVRRGRRAA